MDKRGGGGGGGTNRHHGTLGHFKCNFPLMTEEHKFITCKILLFLIKLDLDVWILNLTADRF